MKVKLLLAAILFANAVLGQENKLNPVTVTSSITPINASQTGRNIVVIKGEQFAKQPVNSIDDLLKYLPGVEVQQRGIMGAQADIIIRGGTFQQVLVVLDGIRLNDPLTGHFSGYIPIAPYEIDRVEILYGSSSAIYGTEAVGGVINIITKTFQSLKQKTTTHSQVSVSGGEFGLINVNAGTFQQTKNQSFAIGLLTNNADGQQQRGTTGYVHNTTASFSYANTLNKNWKLALRGAYDSRDFAAQNFYTTFKSDTATEKVKSIWSQLLLSYQKNNSELNIQAGYKGSNDYYKFNSGLTPNENDANLFQTLVTYSHKQNDNTATTIGLQYVGKSITSNDRGNHNSDIVATFLTTQSQLLPKVFLSSAFRVDHSNNIGTVFTAQANASYKIIKNMQLRLSIGNTIRDADFTERYNNYGKALVTSGSIGNPNLNTEKSVSFEVGADYWVKNNLKFSASWFQRNQQDLIDFVTTPYANMPRKDNLSSTGVYALAMNISKVNTAGLELSTQYNKAWENQSLFITLGTTWLQSRSADSNTKTSFYINSHAAFLLNYNIQYSYKNFAIAVNGIYKQRNELTASAINATITPNYFLANVKVGYTFYKNHINAFVQINNFYDKAYSDLLGSVMPKRWISGGFTIKW